MLCQLVDGAAEQLAIDRCQHMWQRMHFDGDLGIVGEVTMVLGAEMETVLRFRRYSQKPFALWRLCKRWYPQTYSEAIQSFLSK